ncbi:S66 peptidase family protein [Shouchella patagoniensis]|uniref:S66 peptidase family protein n=1 Tax=Shouchella patagoniensis TaxID=228576 RepID=UPI000994D477|nr:LD-carboxypeptidase [Shouchella patagoniensis]
MPKKAKILKPGDTIGVIAPASAPSLKRVYEAKRIYEQMGLQVVVAPSVSAEYGYLGGTDQERITDLEDMFRNPDIKGIFCACGGYGTPRIVDKIDYDLIRNNPKVFWGYSDITCLHTAIHQETGLITFHGPMLSSDLANGSVDSFTLNGLKQVLQEKPMTIDESTESLVSLEEGVVNGRLVGGNLTLICSLLGTNYEINTEGAILFIEEIEEEPYRIDRMLNQLRLAGKLDGAVGYVIGNFNKCEPKKREKSFSLNEVLNFYLKKPGKPCLKGVSIGHCNPALSIPYGANAVLDANLNTITIESGVEG